MIELEPRRLPAGAFFALSLGHAPEPLSRPSDDARQHAGSRCWSDYDHGGQGGQHYSIADPKLVVDVM